MARQLIKGRVYLCLWLQEDKGPPWQGTVVAGTAENLHLSLQAGRKKRNLKWCQSINSQRPPQWHPFFNKARPPKAPKQHHQLETKWSHAQD